MKNFISNFNNDSKLFTCFFIMAFIPIILNAQDNIKNAFTLPQITSPSPTVAQLMKFEEVSLNHYTGQPNIDIPLFSKNIHGLNYNLALQYQVSGIRVDEQSGWVGKGWALDTGGVISRSVVGLPDELNMEGEYIGINHNQFYDYFDWNVLEHFSVENQINTNSDAYKIREYYFGCLWATDYALDYQRDIYQFNFFGNIGRFIFIKEGTNLVPKIIGNDSKLKIEVAYETDPSLYYNQVIKSFTVTDTNGFVYTFDQVEQTEKLELNQSNPRGDGQAVLTPKSPQIPKFRSAWKLSKVDLKKNGHNLLTISYNDVEEKPKIKGQLVQYSVAIPGSTPTGVGIGPYCDVAINNALKPSSIISHYTLTIDSKKVEQITFRDSTKVIFKTSSNHPEYQGVQLNKVSILAPNGIINKMYNLNYDPHMRLNNSNLGQNADHRHDLLFLNEIVETSGILENKYVFSYDHFIQGYNTLENLKAYNLTSRDDFGYYRSDNNETRHLEVISGALQSITYPTGGKRKFNWESNTYSFKGDDLLTFEEIFENPENYTLNTSISPGPFHHIANTVGVPSANQGPITINIAQKINIEYQIQNGQEYINPYSFYIEYGLLGSPNNIGVISIDGNNVRGKVNVFLDPGQYWFRVRRNIFTPVTPPFENDNNTYEVGIELLITSKTLNRNKLNWWAHGGGLRLKSSQDVDKDSTLVKTSFNYALEPFTQTSLMDGTVTNYPSKPLDYPEPLGVIIPVDPIFYFSSGSYDGESSLVRRYEVNIKPVINITGVLEHPIRYKVIEYNNVLNAQLTHGNFIGYKNVAAFKTNVTRGFKNIDSGPITQKSVTKYEFSSAIDHPSFPQDYTYPFRYVEDNDYLKGLLKSQKIYDASNKIIKSTVNSYNTDSAGDIRNLVAESLHFEINENAFANGWGGTGPHAARFMYKNFYDYSNNYANPDVYTHNICTGQLLNRANLFIDFGSPFIHSELLLVGPSKKYNEYSYKVELVSKETRDYFYDGTEEAVIGGYPISNKIVETREEFIYNPLNYQIEEHHTYLQDDDGEEHYLTKYYYSTESMMLNQNRINEILTVENFKDGEGLSMIHNEFKNFNQGDLDLNNDVVMLEKVRSLKSDISVTNTLEDRIEFHDYDDYSNPLEVSKTDGTHIIYVWGYEDTQPIAKIENATYVGMSSSLFSAITSAKTASNNDNDHCREADCKEQLLRDALEQLRNHEDLSNAVVSTYTYDPLIGVTSVTDPRGYTIYYEYDDFNRLKLITDSEDYILSKNDYNYRQN